jgi:hypothetical protein
LRVPFVTTKCLEVFEENLSWFSYSVTQPSPPSEIAPY